MQSASRSPPSSARSSSSFPHLRCNGREGKECSWNEISTVDRATEGRAAADCGHGKFEIPVHVRRSLARSVSLDSAPPNRTNECGRDDRPQKISRGRTNGRVRRRCRGFTPPATLARRLNNHDAMPATQKQASLHRLTDGRNEDRVREEQEDFIFKWTESP